MTSEPVKFDIYNFIFRIRLKKCCIDPVFKPGHQQGDPSVVPYLMAERPDRSKVQKIDLFKKFSPFEKIHGNIENAFAKTTFKK